MECKYIYQYSLFFLPAHLFTDALKNGSTNITVSKLFYSINFMQLFYLKQSGAWFPGLALKSH